MIQLLSFFVLIGFKLVMFVFISFAVATYAPNFMIGLKTAIPNAIDATLHWGPMVMGEIEAKTVAVIERIEEQSGPNYAHAEEVEYFDDSEISPDNRF